MSALPLGNTVPFHPSSGENWSPIPDVSTRNVGELSRQFHPAIALSDTIWKVDELTLDLFKSDFNRTLNPVKLVNPQLVDQFQTFHVIGSSYKLEPTVAEVLLQIPEKHLSLKEQLYFTTAQRNPDLPITLNQKFFIAITKLYRA